MNIRRIVRDYLLKNLLGSKKQLMAAVTAQYPSVEGELLEKPMSELLYKLWKSGVLTKLPKAQLENDRTTVYAYTSDGIAEMKAEVADEANRRIRRKVELEAVKTALNALNFHLEPGDLVVEDESLGGSLASIEYSPQGQQRINVIAAAASKAAEAEAGPLVALEIWDVINHRVTALVKKALKNVIESEQLAAMIQDVQS